MRGPVAAIALMAGVAALAQDNASISAIEKLVVTGQTIPATESTIAQSVTVIDRALLASYGSISVAEVLSRQSGMVVDRSPRSGGYASLYLRGADPSHVVILIDHVRQNDPLSSRGSAVDLNALSTDDVERIEIVRGGASLVHAEAMSGVVHIFTRAGNTPVTNGVNRASVQWGGAGLAAVQAALSASEVRVSAAQREQGDGQSGWGRTRAVNAFWGAQLVPDIHTEFSARIMESANAGFPDDSGGVLYALRRTLEMREARTTQFAARTSGATTSAGEFVIEAHYLAKNSFEGNPGVAGGLRDPAGLPPITTDGRYRREGMQAIWRAPLRSPWAWTIGLQHQHETGEFDSRIRFGPAVVPARFERGREVASVLTQVRFAAGALALEAGTRVEHASDAGGASHPAASLLHTLPGDMGRWGAAWSQASKWPSFYALGHPLVGNADLRREQVRQSELFWSTAARSAWPTRITLFDARYRDLIDFESGPPPRLVNRSRVNTRGIETQFAHEFAPGWRVRIETGLMRVDDPEGDVVLRYRPRAQAGLTLSAPLPGLGSLDAHLHYVGRRLDSAIPTGDVWLSPTSVLNLAARIPLPGSQEKRIELLFALDNALNTRHEETIGTPIPSRHIRLGLSWSP